MTEESLFHEALAKPPGERAAFLDAACAGQPQLRAAVEALLAAHAASGHPLDRPAPAPPALTGEYTPEPEQGPTATYVPQGAGPGAVVAGRYTLVEKIGEGGMGEVWVAKQTEPVKRKVALKLIKAGMDSKAVLARFEQERQALALMDHPHIARVLDGGLTPSGQPFFVMELVNGLPLTRFCDEARLTPRDRLELFVPICQAVQHAHHKGVVHRDLKPSNILVTLIDGRPVPKVIDFGLAKATGGKLTDESLSTQFGAVVGTLEYMAPEQAGYSGQDTDTRADVYALGVILYELLTGLKPHDGRRLRKAALTEMVRIIREEEPSKPSTRLSSEESLPSLAALRQTEPKKLMAMLRSELDWVVMKCLEKQRDRRYETANGLARDLQRYLADEPVEARPPSAGYRIGKFLRRNKGPVIAASLLVLALVAGVVGTTLGLLEARRQRDAAEAARLEEARQRTAADEARSREADQREQAQQSLYYSNLARAQFKYRAHSVADAEDLLDRCPDARRGWEWRYLKQLCHADLFTLPRDNQTGHTGWVHAVAYSPDGKWLASAGGGNPFWESAGSGGMRPGEVILWDAAGAPIRTLHGHNNLVVGVAFSPDGGQIASASPHDSVRVWETATGRLLRVLPEGWSVAFSPDGKWLATGNSKESVQVWDLAAGPAAAPVPQATFAGGVKGNVVRVAFSPDSRRLAGAISGPVGEVKVWNVPAGTEALALQSPTGPMNGVQFSPDGRYLAADLGGQRRASLIRLWDAATGQLLQSLAGHGSAIPGLAFDPTGERLASAGADGTVRAWSVPKGQQIRLYRGHRGTVQAVAFRPDGMRLTSASTDGTLKVWDLTLDPETDPETADVPAGEPTFELEALAFVGEGQQLLVARRGGRLRTLDCDTQAEVGPVRQVPLTGKWMTPAEPAAFDPGGHWLAGISGDDPRVARCWDARTGAERAALRGHTQELWLVTINSGGLVATAGRPARGEAVRSEVKVWDGATGRALLELDERDFLADRVALNPQGDRLAVCGRQVLPPAGADGKPRRDAVVRVYDVATGQTVRSFAGGDDVLMALAFSPDGAHLAAAGVSRQTVLLWDLAAERPTVTHQGPEWAMDLAFSPDGRRVAVASRRMVKLLDAASGEEVLILRGFAHRYPDTNGFNPRVRFSPDGRRIAAVCHDYANPVSIWSGEEAGSDRAGRQRAADRRALASHLEEANLSLKDAKRQANFRFHLRWLGEAEVNSAADLAARGALYARDGQWDRATADFTRATQLAPDDETIWFDCGAGLADAGRWEQALPYFSRFADRGRGTDAQWRSITALSLYLNDREAYRSRCQKMLELFGRSADPSFVSQLLIWGPMAGDSGVDPQGLLRQADRCLAGNENHTGYYLMVQAKGIAEYRAGRMEQALEWLRKAESLLTAEREFEDANKVVNFFFLGMAYQRLGRAEEAKPKYQQGLRHMEKVFGGLDQYQPGKGEWFDWTWCQVVRREAEAVLSGNDAGKKP
jgi:eukaryotic-like serine/threonine-protein kinase